MRAILPLLFAVIVAGSSLAGAATRLPTLEAERWVNSSPLTNDALRGKVVLIDVWEYTWINWIRTSPYVKAWHRDYASLGLVVIGVHSPEFERSGMIRLVAGASRRRHVLTLVTSDAGVRAFAFTFGP